MLSLVLELDTNKLVQKNKIEKMHSQIFRTIISFVILFDYLVYGEDTAWKGKRYELDHSENYETILEELGKQL